MGGATKSYGHSLYVKSVQEVWELLCTTTMWLIWTPRCSKVFDNSIIHLVESVRNVWM